MFSSSSIAFLVAQNLLLALLGSFVTSVFTSRLKELMSKPLKLSINMGFRAHIKNCTPLLNPLLPQTKTKPRMLKGGYDKLICRAFTGSYSIIPRVKYLLRAMLDTVGFHCESEWMTVQHLDGVHSQLRLPQKTWDMRRILFSDHEKTTHRVHLECTLDHLQKHRSCILCYAHRLV